MNRALLTLFCLFQLMAAGYALDVDVDELKSVEQEVVFINYQGVQDRIESAEDIKGIGWQLARSLERDETLASFLLKYSVIHAVDPQESGKFDADIISIDKEARVDHIDNVRRIAAGYLEAAYGYSPEDARLLAFFITIYNAVYRGKMEYFSQNYKQVVRSHLNPENAGISTRYFEWPGATRMLIPLSGEGEETLSALSTSELTEEEVVQELRQREDMGLEDRKEMVEFKEREVEEKKDAVAQERERLEEERTALEERKEALDKGEASPEEQRAVEEKEREIAAAEVEVERKEEEIRQKEEEVAEERKQVVEDERSRDQEVKPVEEEKEEAAAAVYSDKLYYLQVRQRDPAGYITGSLSVIDPISEIPVVTSSVSWIAGRQYYFFQDRILVIAHQGSASGPTRLLLLHPHTLEPVHQSTDPVYRRSLLTFQSGFIYAVVEAGEAFSLGKFDETLTLIARSAEPVDRDSSIALFGRNLYVKDPAGNIMVLEDGKLERVSQISPGD